MKAVVQPEEKNIIISGVSVDGEIEVFKKVAAYLSNADDISLINENVGLDYIVYYYEYNGTKFDVGYDEIYGLEIRSEDKACLEYIKDLLNKELLN